MKKIRICGWSSMYSGSSDMFYIIIRMVIFVSVDSGRCISSGVISMQMNRLCRNGICIEILLGCVRGMSLFSIQLRFEGIGVFNCLNQVNEYIVMIVMVFYSSIGSRIVCVLLVMNVRQLCCVVVEMISQFEIIFSNGIVLCLNILMMMMCNRFCVVIVWVVSFLVVWLVQVWIQIMFNMLMSWVIVIVVDRCGVGLVVLIVWVIVIYIFVLCCRFVL